MNGDRLDAAGGAAQGLHPFGLVHTSIHVDKSAGPCQLLEEFSLLFSAVASALDTMTDVASSSCAPSEIRDSWWVMFYTLRASKGVLAQLEKVLSKAANGGAI